MLTGMIRRAAKLAGLVYFCVLAIFMSAAGAAEVQLIDDFNRGLSPHWQNQQFSGLTDYSIVELDGESVLQAKSEAAASALVFEKGYRLDDYPILSWRWKIAAVLPRGDARSKAGDDYPARIYVVFPHWNPLQTRSINYIWANKLPLGAQVPSLYTANSVMIAAQSGAEKAGRWVSERHNVLEDYRQVFGEDPPAVGAIVIMSDSDDTGDSTQGWYDDIRIEKASGR